MHFPPLTFLFVFDLQVRLVERGPEQPANGGLRKGLGLVQHWRSVHANRNSTGPGHVSRTRFGRGQLPTRRRNLSIYSRKLHQRAKVRIRSYLVQWLWEMTRVREVMGLNPCTVNWMDMTFFHIAFL